MNMDLLQPFPVSWSLPRIAVLASVVLSVTLLIAAPMVLPHATSADGAIPATTSTTTFAPIAYRPKPSPAHRIVRHPDARPADAARVVTTTTTTSDDTTR